MHMTGDIHSTTVASKQQQLTDNKCIVKTKMARAVNT